MTTIATIAWKVGDKYWTVTGGGWTNTAPDDVEVRETTEKQLRLILRANGFKYPITIDDYSEAVQNHINDVAKSKGYADGVAFASYVASVNQQWASEAIVFAKWRDDVWAYAYEQLAAVQSGARQAAPSVAGLVLELPQIDWQAAPVTDLQAALERIAHLENALGEFVSRIESGT